MTKEEWIKNDDDDIVLLCYEHFSRKVEVISGLTYFFSTVKEGMDMICVNYLVLLIEVECSKYKETNNQSLSSA